MSALSTIVLVGVMLLALVALFFLLEWSLSSLPPKRGQPPPSPIPPVRKRIVPATSDFARGDRVAYVPHHAAHDGSRRDVEFGTVTSANEHYVFVAFDAGSHESRLLQTIPKACHPSDLTKEEP